MVLLNEDEALPSELLFYGGETIDPKYSNAVRVVNSATVSDIQCCFRWLYLSTVMSYVSPPNEGMQETIKRYGCKNDHVESCITRPAVRLGLA